MPDFQSDALYRLLGLDDWRLERLARHLQAKLHDPLSLSRAAELCGLETTYFSRYFRIHTGVNFSDWYREMRIERAKDLLRNQRAKVDGVWESVGYRHITTFERAFRKCTGTCPAEYRRAFRTSRQPRPQESPTTPQETITTAQQTLRR